MQHAIKGWKQEDEELAKTVAVQTRELERLNKVNETTAAVLAAGTMLGKARLVHLYLACICSFAQFYTLTTRTVEDLTNTLSASPPSTSDWLQRHLNNPGT